MPSLAPRQVESKLCGPSRLLAKSVRLAGSRKLVPVLLAPGAVSGPQVSAPRVYPAKSAKVEDCSDLERDG